MHPPKGTYATLFNLIFHHFKVQGLNTWNSSLFQNNDGVGRARLCGIVPRMKSQAGQGCESDSRLLQNPFGSRLRRPVLVEGVDDLDEVVTDFPRPASLLGGCKGYMNAVLI